MKRKLIIGLVVATIVVILVAIVAPALVKWLIGGAAVGGAALVKAQKVRRAANKEHRVSIEAERREVDSLQADADAEVSDATSRADEDPQADAASLTEAERRERLDDVARRVK